jgi:hypothetical protein
VADGEGGLNEACSPGGGVEVADVGLDRAEGAELGPVGAEAEGAREGGDLYGVTELGGGAVCLDEGDGVGLDGCGYVCGADDLGLAVEAWSGVADLERAVVVDGRALDDGVDEVLVGEGVVEALEDEESDAVAADGAAGVRVEGAAVAVRGGDGARSVGVADLLGGPYGDAAGEGDVALAGE